MTTTQLRSRAASEAHASVLSVQDLRVVFGSTEIVRGVSLDVAPGTKVGIVGESGCGKSTLALAVLGLLAKGGKITGGSVSVLGRNLVNLTARQLDGVRGKDLSLVFQDPLTSLDPVKTIGDQIAEASRRHNPKLKRAELAARSVELLASVGVSDPVSRLGQYPHEFSGGMRQRVLIAIAIANDPGVLIADEPTTALDVTTQAQVMDVLDRLVHERGISVVLITHDLGVVAEFCDTVHVMYAGRVVETGTTAELFASPAHPYTRALLASLPLPGRSRDEALQWIPGAPPSLAALPVGCSYVDRCPVSVAICAQERPTPVTVDGADLHWAECFLADQVEDHGIPSTAPGGHNV